MEQRYTCQNTPQIAPNDSCRRFNSSYTETVHRIGNLRRPRIITAALPVIQTYDVAEANETPGLTKARPEQTKQIVFAGSRHVQTLEPTHDTKPALSQVPQHRRDRSNSALSPSDWPLWRKWSLTALAIFATFTCTINGTTNTAAHQAISARFDIDDAKLLKHLLARGQPGARRRPPLPP